MHIKDKIVYSRNQRAKFDTQKLHYGNYFKLHEAGFIFEQKYIYVSLVLFLTTKSHYFYYAKSSRQIK